MSAITKKEQFHKELGALAEPLKDAARVLRSLDSTYTSGDVPLSTLGNNILIAVNNLTDRAITEDKKLRFVCARSAQEMERVTQALCASCKRNVQRR